MRLSRRTLVASAAALPFTRYTSDLTQSASARLSEELAEASSRITALGRYVPGGELDGTLGLNWIDPERQLFHIALDLNDEAKLSAFTQSTFGTGPELLSSLRAIESEIGFNYLNIRQAISAQSAPNIIQMFQLNMDVAELASTWEKAGYEERKGDVGSFWTIGEDAEFDMEHPIQKVAIASLNNIALLDDHSIAFAPTSELLGKVMATAAGDQPNVLDGLHPVTEALPETAISAMYVDGSVMAYQLPEVVSEEQALKFDGLMAESDDAVGPMPVVRTVCAGTTQGAAREEAMHDPNSRSYMIVETDAGAEQATAVITWRLENMMSIVSGQPYSDLIGEIEFTVISDDVLVISSKVGANRAIFNEMLLRADHLLFAYKPEE